MRQSNSFSRFSIAALVMSGLLLGGNAGFAQTKPATMPDAQIEANVLKALAGAPELADQSITSTTVYGTVTLNGTVRDESSRDLAEHLVATAVGVQKVVDQLTISVPAAATNDSQQTGTNPNLQSDGNHGPAARADSAGAELSRTSSRAAEWRSTAAGSVSGLRCTTIGPISSTTGSVSSALQRAPAIGPISSTAGSVSSALRCASTIGPISSAAGPVSALWRPSVSPAVFSSVPAAAAVCSSKRGRCGGGSKWIHPPGADQSGAEQQECSAGHNV